MRNDKMIENLFVLHFYWHEVQGHVGRKFKPIVFDEYTYDWNLETPNFKIIKSLLIIEGESVPTILKPIGSNPWLE